MGSPAKVNARVRHLRTIQSVGIGSQMGWDWGGLTIGGSYHGCCIAALPLYKGVELEQHSHANPKVCGSIPGLVSYWSDGL